MTRRDISAGVGNISARYIEEAGNYSLPHKRESFFRRRRHRPLIAAVLSVCMMIGGFIVLSPSESGVPAITAHAYGTDEEITSAGAAYTAGKIDDNGELTGHPLMFHLAGENIETVRYSCKHEQINFIDLTERRDEFGLAQNFTVAYGDDESEYGFLLIDWVPGNLISELKNDENTKIASLPDEMRRDVIVMEITFANGKSVTKAIAVSLQEDGTFHAAFDDYSITDADAFVRREDSVAIPRSVQYAKGKPEITFWDQNKKEVLPEGNWYNTKNIEYLLVEWSGREPETVQVFFTPSGTETAESMELLETKVPNNAESAVLISADSIHRRDLMGHLQIVVNFGSSSILSDLYHVIYDPGA